RAVAIWLVYGAMVVSTNDYWRLVVNGICIQTREQSVKQYLDLCQRIVDEGVWIANERTGKRCLTVINADLEYRVDRNEFPLITTRKSYWKAAIAELLGYIRGYSNAADFRALGTPTWDANANLNEAWLANP